MNTTAQCSHFSALNNTPCQAKTYSFSRRGKAHNGPQHFWLLTFQSILMSCVFSTEAETNCSIEQLLKEVTKAIGKRKTTTKKIKYLISLIFIHNQLLRFISLLHICTLQHLLTLHPQHSQEYIILIFHQGNKHICDIFAAWERKAKYTVLAAGPYLCQVFIWPPFQ